MQTNEMNLENRVESSTTGKLGTGIGARIKSAMYAARQYIAIGAAAIALSAGVIGTTGCDSGGDDDGTYSSSSGCSHLHGGRAGYMEDGCSEGSYCECKDVTNKDGYSTHNSCSCVSENTSTECKHCY